MIILTKYSSVTQAPGSPPYTICAYSGTDLSQVVGITQTDMPDNHYGWIQICGEGLINVSGQTQPAYADFRPNEARIHLCEESTEDSQEPPSKLPTGALDEKSLARQKQERLRQLPPLLIETGAYCRLLREAREVFIDGHFYACVAMCGISFERFQRDKAKAYGATQKDKMWQVRKKLCNSKALKSETLRLCERMADLRNKYAHGDGANPQEEALEALVWMHSFIDNETNLMRDYIIVNGVLSRKDSMIGPDTAM